MNSYSRAYQSINPPAIATRAALRIVGKASAKMRRMMASTMKYTTLLSIIALVLTAAVAVHPTTAFALEPEVGAAAQLTGGQILRDERIDLLRAYLTAYSSPLASETTHFVAEADRLGLDWKLVAAIAGTESTFGKHIPSVSYNAWGWGIPTGAQGGIVFGSWKQGITTVSEGLANRYVARGAVTVEQIGRMYAASPRWAGSVRFFMNRIERFTPTDPDLLEVTL